MLFVQKQGLQALKPDLQPDLQQHPEMHAEPHARVGASLGVNTERLGKEHLPGARDDRLPAAGSGSVNAQGC